MRKKLVFIDEDGIEREDLIYSDFVINEFYSKIRDTNYSVYAVSGDWGTGKTSFVKIWENFLTEKQQLFIHIDAFKMDYESDPFMMLVKAFKDFMREKNIGENRLEDWLNKAKNIFSLKNMMKLGFNIIVDKTIGLEQIRTFMNTAYNSCFEELSKEKSLYDDLILALTKITEKF